MDIYTSIVLASCLILHFPSFDNNSINVQQQLFAKKPTEDSPPPGCDRTDPPQCQPRKYQGATAADCHLPWKLKGITVGNSSLHTGSAFRASLLNIQTSLW